MCISRATVSAVSCLVVPAFICIDLLILLVLKINDDDDDENTDKASFTHNQNFLQKLLSTRREHMVQQYIMHHTNVTNIIPN